MSPLGQIKNGEENYTKEIISIINKYANKVFVKTISGDPPHIEIIDTNGCAFKEINEYIKKIDAVLTSIISNRYTILKGKSQPITLEEKKKLANLYEKSLEILPKSL